MHALHAGNKSELQSFFHAMCKSSYSTHNDYNTLHHDFVNWLMNDANKIDCMSIINWHDIIDYVDLITKLNNGCLEKGYNSLSIFMSLYLKRDIIIMREDLHNKILIINS